MSRDNVVWYQTDYGFLPNWLHQDENLYISWSSFALRHLRWFGVGGCLLDVVFESLTSFLQSGVSSFGEVSAALICSEAPPDPRSALPQWGSSTALTVSRGPRLVCVVRHAEPALHLLLCSNVDRGHQPVGRLTLPLQREKVFPPVCFQNHWGKLCLGGLETAGLEA